MFRKKYLAKKLNRHYESLNLNKRFQNFTTKNNFTSKT